MREIRGGEISIIFQEPMTSLSALHTVGDQIGEAVELHGGGGHLSNIHSLGNQMHEAAERSRQRMSRAEIDQLTIDMLRMVGFPDPKRALRTYPFELSGGLRQRAMIAMALVCRPALLIADEPTTALDVTIQAQILRLMKDLQKELGMALLMITHDLGVVANVADDVVVMYRGKVVESGNLHDIFADPQHPYLKALLHAVPRFDMKPGERLQPIREIKASTGHLLQQKAEVAPTESFNPAGAGAEGPPPHQDLQDPQGRHPARVAARRRHDARRARGQRRELRRRARRVPGAGRRIGLRQDHALARC